MRTARRIYWSAAAGGQWYARIRRNAVSFAEGILGTGPDDRDPIGLDLPRLPAPWRCDQLAFDRNRRAGAEILCFRIVADAGVHDDLDVSETRPIVDLKKGKTLGIPAGPNPPLDQHLLARRLAIEECHDFVSFQRNGLFHGSRTSLRS